MQDHLDMTSKMKGLINQLMEDAELRALTKGGPSRAVADTMAALDKAVKLERQVLGIDKHPPNQTRGVMVVVAKMADDDWEEAARRMIQDGEKDVLQVDYSIVEEEED